MSSSEIILEGQNLTKEFPRGRREVIKALDNVNVSISRGEFLMLYGPSGSGKTTLLNVLSGLDRPTSGKVIFEEKDIVDWSEQQLSVFRLQNIGRIFQSWELISTLTAIENIEVPLYPSQLPSNKIHDRAIRLVKMVGLADRMDHFPAELSGGEQQRVGIARALITNPVVIFADEPTGNLDSDSGKSVMRLLKRICNTGTAVVLSTHNEELREYANRIVKLRAGRLH
ncbi:MAG: ABC transporter ATP-binding protein [Candidatus Hodarchaeota archaeon]